MSEQEAIRSGRGLAIAALAISLVSLLLAFETFRQAILPQDVMAARSFSLVDRFDNGRARLEIDGSGAVVLRVYDDADRRPISVEFGADIDGPLL